MLKKVQLTIALLLIILLCFAFANRWGIFRLLTGKSRVLINEQWIAHTVEKKYPAAEVSSLDIFTNYSAVTVKRTAVDGNIIVRTTGLPDTAIEFIIADGRLRIEEADVWSRQIRRFSDDRYREWYIASYITVEIPESVHLTELQFDIQSSVQADNIEADSVQINGIGGNTFRMRQCRFGTLYSSGNSNLHISDTAIQQQLSLHSINGNIKLKNLSVPSADITAENGSLYAEKIAFDELLCKMESASCKITGSISKTAVITTEYGNVALELDETAAAEKIAVHSNNGHVMLKGLAAQTADIQSDYGNIRLNNARFNTLHCRTDSGTIHLNGSVTEAAEVISSNGSISIDLNSVPVAEHIKLQTQYGSITAKNLLAAAADIETDNGNADCTNCTVTDLTAVAGGTLSFTGDLNGTNRLTSTYGNIAVTLKRPEAEYAIAAGRRNNETMRTAVENMTIERSAPASEDFSFIAGSANAADKLFLSADNGKIIVKTK